MEDMHLGRKKCRREEGRGGMQEEKGEAESEELNVMKKNGK